MILNRRTFNQALLASGLALGLPLGARGANPRIRFGYVYSNPVGALVAYERGYFREEGLEIELIPVQSGPAAVAATAIGAIDASFGDVLGWASGLSNGFTNVELILPGSFNAVGQLLVAKNSTLRAPQDFKGKRIGIPPPPMIAVSIKVWLEQAGVDPSSVSFVIIPNNGDGQALSRGDVDAVVTFEPATSRIVLEQGAIALLDPTSVAPPKNATFTAYYASKEFLQRDPQLAEQFLTALRRGVRASAELSRQESAVIRGKYSGIDLLKLSQSVPGLLDRIDFGLPQLTALDPLSTQAWVDRGVKYGGVPRPVEIAPYLSASAFQASNL